MSELEIGRLRRKIVLASIVAVFLSLSALILAINYAHYLQVDSSLRSAMEEIASSVDMEKGERNEGNLQPHGEGATAQQEGAQPRKDDMTARQNGVSPNDNGTESQQDVAQSSHDVASVLQDDAQPHNDETDGQQGTLPNGPKQMHQDERKSARTQYGSRFFNVLVTPEGDMLVKAKGNDALSNDDACSLAQRALESGKTEGLLDDYKFVVKEESDGRTDILFLDCTTDLRSLRELLAISLAVGGCALAIATLFTFRFSRLAVRPLEESARKQKQFVADAGHELKTPLSVIATNMDILEVDLADQPEEQEWIDSTRRQVDNMKRLVNDLIVLSKMEEQEGDLVLSEVSLTDLAYESVLTFNQLAHSQSKELVATIDDGVCVRADEPSVRQLMSILIDNAIKYATGDGSIQVEVRQEGRSALFLTRNHWERNVEAHELPSLFDRFVRGEQSRDRSGGSNSYGLGLSIARAIAEKNHAKLEVNEDEEGRIVFQATFARRTKTQE